MDDQDIEATQDQRRWARDVFAFTGEIMGVYPAEPIDSLRGVKIPYTDALGVKREAMLFDEDGNLVYHDLKFYTIGMFKNQSQEEFRKYNGTRFTWQQTVILEGYNRGIRTFGMDSYDVAARFLSTRSGHGIGKTGTMAVIAIHFLFTFPGAQIGMTANTEQQVADVFMKEFAVWKMKLPEFMQQNLVQTADHIRMNEDEDWFLRAQVARPENPVALAGLHGVYILILVDEASGVAKKVFETMKGALTGENFFVGYWSNPTDNEGEFADSQLKLGTAYTRLKFSSRESPIVKAGYIEKMEADYPGTGEEHSDEVKIRVDGEFAGLNEMDEKGWIPLFAQVNVLFEPERGQLIKHPIIGVDPAGQGKDHSVITVRDNIYMKQVLNERTSLEKDLARKVETIRDVYQASSNDIGIDAFGFGAKVVANVNVKMGETVMALLTDKPREEVKELYGTFRDELAWKMRVWLSQGGIIITNHQQKWVTLLGHIKFKRVGGKIKLMDKPTFKKEYGYSPDDFDSAIYTFFRDDPTRPVILTKNEVEVLDMQDFVKKATAHETPRSLSTM